MISHLSLISLGGIMDFNELPTMEVLCRLLRLPPECDAVCRTVDGCYLGRYRGDIGYNRWLGKPSEPHPGPGRDQMLRIWSSLTPEKRSDVVRLADNPPDGAPIPLEDFGLPVDQVA